MSATPISSSGQFIAMTRAALMASGFVRKVVNGWVYFESPDRGNGKVPLVLIHGANDQAGTWFPIAGALAATRRVIIPDLAGHGESEPASGPLPITLFLEELEAVLSAERDLVLVGNSLGGWLASLFALRHPSRVSHLVLETAGGISRPLASELVARDRDEALVILGKVHGPAFVPPEWVIDALLARAEDSPMLRITGVEEHILDAHLPQLTMPVTMIWGANDGVLPVDYAEEFRALIGHGELHVLDGAAHIPHLQQPEKVLQCLTAIS
jgi:pimeloyl-ACP methyl ester carboxylesterase